MIYDSVVGCVGRTPLVYLRRLFPHQDIDVIAKLEFLNPGGSVKDRSARFIVEQGLHNGTIHAKTHLSKALLATWVLPWQWQPKSITCNLQLWSIPKLHQPTCKC
ncbi:MAG: pyridoxal-phosphate dependent enzyme [Brasilonema sp.]